MALSYCGANIPDLWELFVLRWISHRNIGGCWGGWLWRAMWRVRVAGPIRFSRG